MERIWIQFSRPVGLAPFSRLIRIIYGTPYSHVSVKWETRSGIGLVAEASGTSVKLVEHRLWAKDQVITAAFILDTTKERRSKMRDAILQLLGRPYGWRQALGMGIAVLFKLKKNPLGDGNRSLVCSELVGIAIKELLDVDINKDFDIIDPSQIHRLLNSITSKGNEDAKEGSPT